MKAKVPDISKNDISAVRRKKKITQKELAAALDVSPSYLCKIEKSLQEPTERFVKDCAEYLQVAEEELFPAAHKNERNVSPETKLWAVRKEKGIKQYELARALGCSPSYLSKIEKGFQRPTVKIKKLCAKILKVKENELFPNTK